MKVVCDSSVIIGLSVVGKLDILWRLFEDVYVPEAVFYEVCVKGKNRVGSRELQDAVKCGCIKVKKPSNTLLVNSLVDPLGKGEAETIVLALEISADYACIDERIARRKAKQLGIKIKGTIGILWSAMKKNLISIKEFKECLSKLEDFGFRFPKRIIKRYLEEFEKKLEDNY